MKNIVLVRIDDRLIHGQIMTQWSRLYSPTEIMVGDDETCRDSFMTEVLLLERPRVALLNIGAEESKGMALQKEAYALLQEAGEERILMLVKVPETVEALVDRGVEIRALNVGGMCKRAGRSTLYRNISSSPAENETLLRLQKRGVRVYVQVVPEDKEMEIDKVL